MLSCVFVQCFPQRAPMLAVFPPGTIPPSFLKLGSPPRRLPRSCRFSMADGFGGSIARAGSFVVGMGTGMGTGMGRGAAKTWMWWLRIGRRVIRVRRRKRRRVVERAMVLCIAFFLGYCLMLLQAVWVRCGVWSDEEESGKRKEGALPFYILTLSSCMGSIDDRPRPYGCLTSFPPNIQTTPPLPLHGPSSFLFCGFVVVIKG